VLDRVYRDLQRVHPRVAAADRGKIQAHMDAVRDIEHALDSTGECTAPDLEAGLNPNSMSDIPRLFQVQWELLARALACDMTRVASLQFSVSENDQIIYDWLGIDYEVHHLITHSNTGPAKADLAVIYRWYSEQVAYFLDLLDSIPEGDGTVLDNTLVVWGSEIGRGWDHSFQQVPFVLAGGASGAWPTGRFLQLGGVEHNRLLVSVARAMGVDIDTFGLTDVSTGGLPGLL
jgi:hypothetical protein